MSLKTSNGVMMGWDTERARCDICLAYDSFAWSLRDMGVEGVASDEYQQLLMSMDVMECLFRKEHGSSAHFNE